MKWTEKRTVEDELELMVRVGDLESLDFSNQASPTRRPGRMVVKTRRYRVCLGGRVICRPLSEDVAKAVARRIRGTWEVV